MNTINMHENAADAPARNAAGARTGAPQDAGAAPSSNNGAKEQLEMPVAAGESGRPLRGGERLEFVTTGRHSKHVRHPLPVESRPAGAALVDWLAFTVTPPLQNALVARVAGLEDSGFQWMCGELVRVFKVGSASIERKATGRNGYKHRAEFPGGFVCWGGQNQRGTINVSFSGEGCRKIEDWAVVEAWLSEHGASIKRVDLAYDDFDGATVNVEKLRTWFEDKEFGAGGRQPEGKLVDDLGSGKGRTFYVGKRENGKMFRGYEKGKQLGEPTSPWVRVEVEWHDQSRVLPYDMLTRPGQYLAGAYPCLRFLSAEQSKVKTIFRGLKITYDRAVSNLRQQGGKLVNLMLSVLGGDYCGVVEALRRDDGYPKRIEPYSYHLEQVPEALAYPFGMMPGYSD